MVANQQASHCLDHSVARTVSGVGVIQGGCSRKARCLSPELLHQTRSMSPKLGILPRVALWYSGRHRNLFPTKGPPLTLLQDIGGCQPDHGGLLLSPQEFLKEGTLMKVTGKNRRPRHLFLVSTWPPSRPQDCQVL